MTFRCQAPSLRALKPAIPEIVDLAVCRALAQSPSDRFNTTTEFVKVLTPHSVLIPQESKELKAAPFPDVRSYELYLRARQEITSFTEGALNPALRLVREAMSIVGDNERLYATLGFIHWNYYNLGLRTVPDTTANIDACIQKIFELNASSAQGFLLIRLPDFIHHQAFSRTPICTYPVAM